MIKPLTTELFIKPLIAIVVSLCFIKTFPEKLPYSGLFLVFHYCTYMLICVGESERDSGFFTYTYVMVIYTFMYYLSNYRILNFCGKIDPLL